MKKITLINILGTERKIELPDKKSIEITIGRSRDNDIVINEPFLSNFVSRKHCKIFYDSKVYPYPRVMDLDSTNGTSVNDYGLMPQKEYSNLKDGDILKLGNYELKIKLK